MAFADYYTGVAGIGKAYEDGLQRNALAALGDQLQSGNLPGAVQTAFGAGDPATGLKLLALGQQARKDALGLDATRELAAGFGLGGPQGPAPSGNGLAALYGDRGSAPVPSFLDVGNGPSGDYLTGLFKRESNNSDTAQAPTSSARGAGQFTRGTWNQVAAQHPDLNLTPVGGGQDGRTDRAQMVRATQALTSENEGLLQNSGLPVNDATRYALHFLGGGGRRLVAGAMQNPDAPAASFADPKAVAANRNVFFNRDGSPKSAGQVMGDFGRSFGGGGAPTSRQASAAPTALPPGVSGLNPDRVPQAQSRPAQQPVAFADDEAQTQALERRMGMVPQQMASLDPRADMPAPTAQDAGFVIPPGPGGGAPQVLPSSDPNSRTSTAAPLAVPTLSGGAPGGRIMTMPGDPSAVPSAPAAPPPAGAMIGNVPASTIAQAPPTQRIQVLQRALLNPNLPDHVREFASTMLKQSLDETKMPDSLKEFVWARAHGMTQAQNPAAYAREKLRSPGEDLTGQIDARATAAQRFGMDPSSPEFRNYALGSKPERDPGSDLQAQIRAREQEGMRLGMQPGSPELRDYALGSRAERQTEESKISGAIEARRQAAPGLGLVEGSPSWRSFVATGKVGADRDMSAGDKKAIDTADNAVLSAQASIGMLEQAKELSAKAYAGPLASERGKAMSFVPGNEAGQATLELDNLVTTNALTNLKGIFGGNPTEGERKILLDVAGSSNMPHAVRVKIYQRAIDAANLRMQQNMERRNQIQDGTYYRPGGGIAQPQGAVASGRGGAPALPPPSPSNRPGAVAPAMRFQQLIGSGMSEDAAYARLHQEGY